MFGMTGEVVVCATSPRMGGPDDGCDDAVIGED